MEFGGLSYERFERCYRVIIAFVFFSRTLYDQSRVILSFRQGLVGMSQDHHKATVGASSM